MPDTISERGIRMKFAGTVVAVSDMEKAKDFYINLMGLKVEMDLGRYVAFEGGFSMHSDYPELVGVNLKVMKESNSFELYFEVLDIDELRVKIDDAGGADFIHDIREEPWKQKVMRLYDPDRHIVEIAENMGVTAKRLLSQGLTMDQVSEQTMFPKEVLEYMINTIG